MLAVGRAEGVDGDGLALPLGLLAQAQRHVLRGLAPALVIILDIDDDMRGFIARAFAGDAGDQVLQRF